MEFEAPFAAVGKPSTIATKLWVSACLVGLSSFMYGYSITALNSCLVFGNSKSGIDCYNQNDDGSCPPGTIYDDLKLSPFEASLATSLTVVGAWIGSFMGAVPAEKYGRRLTILANSIFYIAGSLLASDGNSESLYIGRLISGLGVGITSAVAPILLSEIAPDSQRGTITTMHQLFITVGVFTAFTVSYGFVTFVENGWQYVQGLGVVAPVLMLLGSPFMAESPKWIVNRRNNHTWALQVLRSIRQPDDDVELELSQYHTNNTNNNSSSNSSSDSSNNDHSDNDQFLTTITYSDVIKNNGRAVFIGCMLMFFQAMCGISSVILYSTTIFGFADFNDALLATVLVGVVNVSTTVLAAVVIERLGRRCLLQGGQLTCFLSLIVLSSVLLAGDSLGEHTQGIVAVVAVLVFIFGYSVGPGVTCWVILTELVPIAVRAKIYGLFVSVHWVCTLLQGLLTLIAIDGIGGYRSSMSDDQRTQAQKHGVGRLYILFAFISLSGIIFVHYYIPETTGRSAEESLLTSHQEDSSGNKGADDDNSSSSAVSIGSGNGDATASTRAREGTFVNTL